MPCHKSLLEKNRMAETEIKLWTSWSVGSNVTTKPSDRTVPGFLIKYFTSLYLLGPGHVVQEFDAWGFELHYGTRTDPKLDTRSISSVWENITLTGMFRHGITFCSSFLCPVYSLHLDIAYSPVCNYRLENRLCLNAENKLDTRSWSRK